MNSTSKNLVVTGLVTVALIAVVLSGCNPTPIASAAETAVTSVTVNSQQQGIWVTGRGEVTATPDIAILRLGIEAQATSVAIAQSEAAAAMQRVEAALAAAGIASKDIQTQYFNIRQVTRWDRDTELEVVTGYRVSNRVVVKLRQVDTAGAVIDAVVKAGGNLTRIDSIAFSVDDTTLLYEEARQKAIADATDRAEQLALLAGVNLGSPTLIIEGGASPIPYPTGGFRVESAMADMQTSISPGEMVISLSVQVAYSILP